MAGIGEASPREFGVADTDLLPELVGSTPSPSSDLLETDACILGHPAVGETKHVRPARGLASTGQAAPGEAPHGAERIVSEALCRRPRQLVSARSRLAGLHPVKPS